MNNIDITLSYPVKRIGNEKNPKLIILLSNPGADPKYYKRLPEYVMEKDGFYKDSGMNLNMEREYVSWWDNILNKTDKYISDSDILALEFYPYHTSKATEIPEYKNWNEYVKNSLDENMKLLKNFMDKNILIFGYYWGGWLQKMPELKDYSNFYMSKNTQGQSNKIKELIKFLLEKNLNLTKKND